MRANLFGRRWTSLLLAVTVCMGLPLTAQAKTYDDFAAITSHVSLGLPNQLAVSRPGAERITSAANSYFLMGSSNPDQPLTLNGAPVENRGVRGSFGVYVALEAESENVFTFQQGNHTETVVIEQSRVTDAPTTKVISSMAPEFDCASESGSILRFSCVAPSGATVRARVGGFEVALRQSAATAKKGVPATFVGELRAPQVSGTKELGRVSYQLNGSESFTSIGSVFLTERAGKLAVQVKNHVANVYRDAERSAFIEVAKQGGVDLVTEMTSSMYKLANGGWVNKSTVQPLTKSSDSRLDVSSADFAPEADGRGEMLTLTGKGRPMFRVSQSGSQLNIKLFDTTLAGSLAAELDEQILQTSELFTGLQAEESGRDLILTLPFADATGSQSFWGYDVSYGADGGMEIYAKYKPHLSAGAKPLTGVVIAVDAGHGGSDPGALGIPLTGGATEKEVTLASAIAVQKRLESLGATVLLCRGEDEDLGMDERMVDAFAARADLFLSLHGNSIGYDSDAGKPSGVEVYYYENHSKRFAEQLSANLADYTGRKNRGAKFSNFRVTLNSYAPSVLIEMGFLSNPAEYDDMTSRRGIYNTANAIGDGVLALLG